MSFISSFDITSVVVPEHKIILCIITSAADAGAINPHGIKALLANGLITHFINGNPFFSNGPRNPPDYIILDNRFFDNLISADELFAKALGRFATCLLVNNNSFGKLVSSLELPIIFDDNIKTISVLFFIADFNLLSSEFDSFTFKTIVLSHFILIKNKLFNETAFNGIAFYNIFTVLLQFLVKILRQFFLLFQ